MGLPRLGGSLLLLALLLAAAPCPRRPRRFCPPLCRCRRRLLDCSHAALASVPPATRCRALSILNFTGNSISSIEKQTWREYPWAEYLVLRNNGLQAVKRRSLEGLLLLKHLDLSGNKILSLEEHAFEPLPFLQLINLERNLITQIRNGTFQAWHGMQFLQQLILSHNPLSTIADASFFELPSVKYLDLGATPVTQQTLLTLLLTTVSLETLKLPGDTACCLCQEGNTTETPCRTIEFQCETLCTTGDPQCAHRDPLAEAQAEITEAMQSRKPNASTVLNLKPKEPSLGDQETVTLEVVVSLTDTDGDLGYPDHISQINSYSPQHLSRQEVKTSKELVQMLQNIQHMGWTSETEIRKLYFLAKVLVAELKKLYKAKSIVTVKNIISPLKDEVQEIPAVEEEPSPGWVQEQHDSGLNQAGLNPWEETGRINPTDNVSISTHHEISTTPSQRPFSLPPAETSHLSGSLKIQNSSDGVEQTKETEGMEDVEDGEDAEEAPSPGQDHGWTDKNDKQGDSSYLNKSHQLSYKTFGTVDPKEEPTPTENKAEQGLNTNQHFFYKVSVNNSTNSSMLEVVRKKKRAEEEGSSLGERSPPVPQTAEKHPKEGSSSLNKPSSFDSLDNASFQGDLFETKLNRHLRLLVPDEALRTFIAHVARTLRTDCSLPQLQLACTKMVSKTGLLVQVLSERQDDQGASALLTQCLLEQNVSKAMARAEEEGGKPMGKWKPEDTSSDKTLLAIAVSAIIMINLTAICLVEICSRKRAATSQPQSTSKSRLRRFFQKLLPPGWRKKKADAQEQGSHGAERSKTKTQWLRDMYQPLDSQQEKSMAELYKEESTDEEEIFNKSDLDWMATAPQKSRDGGETQLPGALMPLPRTSGAAEELDLWSLSTEDDATGGHVHGTPQSSSQRDWNGKAARDRKPS